MATRAYVETSIPSFYFESRPDASMIARRDWTREWWNRVEPGATELVTSLAVIDQLQRGEFPARAECLDLVAALPVLAVEAAILEIVQAYIKHRVMPQDPAGDALHLA